MIARARTEADDAKVRLAKKTLGLVVVGLVGYAERVPRTFVDNEGALSVAVRMSTEPRFVYMGPEAREHGLGREDDIAQPLHPMIELDRVYLRTKQHGVLFRAALRTALHGASLVARHSWRDIPVDFEMAQLGQLFWVAAGAAGVAPFDAGRRDQLLASEIARLKRRRAGLR